MALACLLSTCGGARADETDRPVIGNLQPSAALAAFETEPGLAVELVAAEPLVVDPVAVAWDERGRMFVAENRGYPVGGPDGRPVGVIALLEDTDGDGKPDRRTEFATGLTFPNGVMPWRGGVIVTCAPDVLWFADTDGDGRADTRRVLITGFETNTTTQLRVNAPTLGPDGWVYLAGGLNGGKLTVPEHPERGVFEMQGGDVKFRPDTGEIQLTEGKSQFGLAFDDWGNRFACYNRVQSQHAPLPARAVARHPRLDPPGVLQNCPADMVRNTLMRGEGSASQIFPISANITTADSHAGFYSAACAVHIARGDALPADYLGRAWSCDPTGNLVRSDRLEASGGSFAARRVLPGTEALRSRDNWFRPVFLADGPDGALHVCDMYRRTIEHPEYLPAEVRKHTDFESGKGMGRIYRLVAAEVTKRTGRNERSVRLLTSSATEELVAALSSPNGWLRDTAFRLLVERRPTNAPALLLAALPRRTGSDEWAKRPRGALGSVGDAQAAGRASALNLLAIFAGWTEHAFTEEGKAAKSFPALDPKVAMPLLGALLAATFDDSPGVRQTAFRHLALSPGLSIADDRLRVWAADPHPHVRLWCALMLGNWEVSGSLEALGDIALRDGADRWTRTAVLGALKGRELRFLDRLMQSPANEPPAEFMGALGRLMGPDGTPHDLGQRHWLWAGGPGSDWKLAFWAGVAEGLNTGEKRLGNDPLAERVGIETRRLADLNATAVGLLRDRLRTPAVRLSALAFLRESGGESERGQVLDLVASEEPADLQLAALRIVAAPGALHSPKELLDAVFWRRLSPGLQGVLLTTFLSHPGSQSELLTALESGGVPANALNPGQRNQLLKTKDDALRVRAEKLFADRVGGDRKAAFEDAKAALALNPAPENGHAVFTRTCAGCHRLNREGFAVGPDLFDIRNQPKESILLHIVLPEQEIAPNFTYYECATKDGRAFSGLLAGESAASITLRQAQGLEETVPRSQIASLTASPLSLMPQELEKTMTKQELADLLSYLRGE